MSDLIERLRGWPLSVNGPHTDKLCDEAADEIERLRAVLKPFADAHHAMSTPNQIIDPYEHITLHDLRMAASECPVCEALEQDNE